MPARAVTHGTRGGEERKAVERFGVSAAAENDHGSTKQPFAYFVLGQAKELRHEDRRENLRPRSGSGGARFEIYFASDFESKRFCHSARMRLRLFAANSKSLSIIASRIPSGKCSTGFASSAMAMTA